MASLQVPVFWYALWSLMPDLLIGSNPRIFFPISPNYLSQNLIKLCDLNILGIIPVIL